MMDWTGGQFLKFLFGVFLLGAVAFSQDYDYPAYSEDFLPETSFTCENKIHGRYYADVETDCQMYHVCTRDESGFMKSARFLCGNGTVFDQRKLVCQDYRKVLGCKVSPRYYRLATTRELQRRYEKRQQAILKAAQINSELRDDYDYPTFSSDNMPETSFSCEDKRDGGYYADIETDCQMYHVCSKGKSGFMRSTRFLCGNGTVFDQRKLVCQDHKKVLVCKDSSRYFRLASAVELNRRAERRQLAIAKAAQIEPEIRNDYDYPTYSEVDLPVTSFSCKDKVNGGYYADIETDCQMYHVCSKDKFGFMRSTRFLCGNGTVFEQQHLVCQDYAKVHNCKNSPRYYRNHAAVLELLEARLRSEKRDQEILKSSQFDSGRLK